MSCYPLARWQAQRHQSGSRHCGALGSDFGTDAGDLDYSEKRVQPAKRSRTAAGGDAIIDEVEVVEVDMMGDSGIEEDRGMEEQSGREEDSGMEEDSGRQEDSGMEEQSGREEVSDKEFKDDSA